MNNGEATIFFILTPGQNGSHIVYDILRCNFVKTRISNTIPRLQMMAKITDVVWYHKPIFSLSCGWQNDIYSCMWCQVVPKSIKYRFVVFLLSNHVKWKYLIAMILNYGIWRKTCDKNRLSPFGNYPRNDMKYQLWLFGTVAPCVWHNQWRCFVLTFEWLRERHYCIYFGLTLSALKPLVNQPDTMIHYAHFCLNTNATARWLVDVLVEYFEGPVIIYIFLWSQGALVPWLYLA